jgi:DNA-binding IclR family transcriptional regulator
MASIQVLDRAFRILELVAKDPDAPHRVGDIARELGIKQTTCTNIIGSLVRHGYLEPVLNRRGYLLGPTTHALTRNRPYKRELIDAAHPHMVRLVREVNETCLLAVLKYTSKVVLCHVEKDSALQVRTEFIERQNPYESATGRLLIAALNDREVASLVREMGYPGDRWDGIGEELALRSACAGIRSAGHCIGKKPGDALVGVAFPVFQGGAAQAALGLYLLESEFGSAHRKHIMAEMKVTAERISEELARAEALGASDRAGWKQERGEEHGA